jgi:2-polyprenyl-3-methyl-5-hydroxy-6-metoxy-1,4-benzoquinol methylase
MPEQPQSGSEPLIDVEQLVDELRERVEEERAAGGYSEDVAAVALDSADGEPRQARGPSAGTPTVPQVIYRPEVGYSSRPVIGPVLTGVKRLFYRLFQYPLDDLAHQTNAAVHQLHARGDRAEQAVETVPALRERIDTLANQLELAHRLTAESLGRDVRSLAERLAELEAAHERLQVQSRLGRLERLARTPARPAPSTEPSPAAATPATTGAEPPSFDYMTFENRFRPENTVRERQSAYLDLLGAKKRVVDLGCGRGELLELLGEANVSAYGIDLDPDNVAVCQEKGLDVIEGDAISHLESLDGSAVDAIVASHVIEHLEADALWRLVAAAAEKLAADGILILETPNPESLLAGSINFHRDPTHVRPVHPETLAFLCESAGFREVEIRRLAPVPEEARLPQGSDDEYVREVVKRLDELIYGYQDYALVARR